jgi:hypothetical protein
VVTVSPSPDPSLKGGEILLRRFASRSWASGLGHGQQTSSPLRGEERGGGESVLGVSHSLEERESACLRAWTDVEGRDWTKRAGCGTMPNT